jgi:hypothetical protein
LIVDLQSNDWFFGTIQKYCTGDIGEGGQGIPIVDYSVVGTTPGLSQEAVGAIHIVDHSLVESG